MPQVGYSCIFISQSVERKTELQAKGRNTTTKRTITRNCISMLTASFELPEHGASSRNAPDAFITLRPAQSSKWTWRFSYSFKMRTRTERIKWDGPGKERALSDTRYIPATYRRKNENKIWSTWLMKFHKGIDLTGASLKRPWTGHTGPIRKQGRSLWLRLQNRDGDAWRYLEGQCPLNLSRNSRLTSIYRAAAVLGRFGKKQKFSYIRCGTR